MGAQDCIVCTKKQRIRRTRLAKLRLAGEVGKVSPSLKTFGFQRWRRGRDSNPGAALWAATRLPSARFRPLSHLSIVWADPANNNLCLAARLAVISLRSPTDITPRSGVKKNGEGGIRTHESLATLPLFESGPVNHLGTSPASYHFSAQLAAPSLDSLGAAKRINGGGIRDSTPPDSLQSARQSRTGGAYVPPSLMYCCAL